MSIEVDALLALRRHSACGFFGSREGDVTITPEGSGVLRKEAFKPQNNLSPKQHRNVPLHAGRWRQALKAKSTHLTKGIVSFLFSATSLDEHLVRRIRRQLETGHPVGPLCRNFD